MTVVSHINTLRHICVLKALNYIYIYIYIYTNNVRTVNVYQVANLHPCGKAALLLGLFIGDVVSKNISIQLLHQVTFVNGRCTPVKLVDPTNGTAYINIWVKNETLVTRLIV